MKRRNTPIRHGFALVELLVVISIIVLLATILLPSISKARAIARAKVCRSALISIEMGLTLYKQDFGLLPTTDDMTRNSLVDCLIADRPAGEELGDGHDGPGFKVMSGPGKVYGPYVKPGSIRVKDGQFVDGFGHSRPIRFYLKTTLDETVGDGDVDNDEVGDRLKSHYVNGADDSPKIPDGGYLLISAGLDGDLTTIKDNITNLSD